MNAKSSSWQPQCVIEAEEEVEEEEEEEGEEEEAGEWRLNKHEEELHKIVPRSESNPKQSWFWWENKQYLHHVAVHYVQLLHRSFVGFVHFHIVHGGNVPGT